MGWFGIGGSDNNDDSSSVTSYDPGSSFESGSSGAADLDGGSSSLGMGGGAGGGVIGASPFEQDLVMEQQKAMVQAIMARLTEISFKECITKPSSSLSSSETNCIKAVTTKYLDASEFTVARFSQKQGQQK